MRECRIGSFEVRISREAQDFMWYIRSKPKVVSAFARVWGTEKEDLIVSFDGCCAFRPPSVDHRPLDLTCVVIVIHASQNLSAKTRLEDVQDRHDPIFFLDGHLLSPLTNFKPETCSFIPG